MNTPLVFLIPQNVTNVTNRLIAHFHSMVGVVEIARDRTVEEQEQGEMARYGRKHSMGSCVGHAQEQSQCRHIRHGAVIVVVDLAGQCTSAYRNSFFGCLRVL